VGLRGRHAPTGASVVVSGGPSGIGLWNQIKADVLGRPAVRAGIYATPEQAARSMAVEAKRFDPDPAHGAVRAEMFERYTNLYPALRECRKRKDERPEPTEACVWEERCCVRSGHDCQEGIAHLLTLAGYRITFVEKNAELVALARRRKAYAVHILGAPGNDIAIAGFDVLESAERGGDRGSRAKGPER
jgi:hypothetical protein